MTWTVGLLMSGRHPPICVQNTVLSYWRDDDTLNGNQGISSRSIKNGQNTMWYALPHGHLHVVDRHSSRLKTLVTILPHYGVGLAISPFVHVQHMH